MDPQHNFKLADTKIRLKDRRGNDIDCSNTNEQTVCMYHKNVPKV